jgi:hypothetical protein
VKNKIISPRSKYIPAPPKKVSKNYNENWHHRNLPELPIVPHRDFGPLGVKSSPILLQSFPETYNCSPLITMILQVLKGVGWIIPYTWHHSKNVESGGFLFLEFWYQILVLKVLNYSSGSQFIINKDKNRGRFLFTFPHPSWNGMSIWVNFPWASKRISKSFFVILQWEAGPPLLLECHDLYSFKLDDSLYNRWKIDSSKFVGQTSFIFPCGKCYLGIKGTYNYQRAKELIYAYF